jgi:peptidoglycan hydrolase CwlO-like protein
MDITNILVSVFSGIFTMIVTITSVFKYMQTREDKLYSAMKSLEKSIYTDLHEQKVDIMAKIECTQANYTILKDDYTNRFEAIIEKLNELKLKIVELKSDIKDLPQKPGISK